MRDFKRTHKLGRFADGAEEKIREKEKQEEEMAGKIKVGDRCEVSVEGAPARRGTVRFVGTCPCVCSLRESGLALFSHSFLCALHSFIAPPLCLNFQLL